MFKLNIEKEITDKQLEDYINKHSAEVNKRYKALEDAYNTDYEIMHMDDKPDYKPDNRIAVNFAKYIVDTMNGFFIGQPIKTTSEDKSVADYLELLDQYNNQDDNNAELSKICSIYGKGYEMYFVDELGNIGITYLDPTEAFMIYDTSILKRPRAFVRLYKDDEDILHGSLSDDRVVKHFIVKKGIEWQDEQVHGFDGVPATAYVENAEETGLFEPVMSLINAYNKAISEKANDVDYFADAYLKILGEMLDEDDVQHIRDNRIINFGGDGDKLIVEFLNKPDGDTTQENLINRLEKLIFQICMVANISDENFGTQSGIAIKYKLQAMSNLAKTKERKFTAGMNRRYKLIFSNPVSGMKLDSWLTIKYHFTQNYPTNLLEQAQIAQALSGITSQETQLKVLSIVDNPLEEMEKIKEEEQAIRPNLFPDFEHEEPEINHDEDKDDDEKQ